MKTFRIQLFMVILGWIISVPVSAQMQNYNPPGLKEVLAVDNTASATIRVDSILAGTLFGDGSGLTGIAPGGATPTLSTVLAAGNFASTTMVLGDSTDRATLRLDAAGTGTGLFISSTNHNYGIHIQKGALNAYPLFIEQYGAANGIEVETYSGSSPNSIYALGAKTGIMGEITNNTSAPASDGAIKASTWAGTYGPTNLFMGTHKDTSSSGRLFYVQAYNKNTTNMEDTFFMSNSGSIAMGRAVVVDTTNMIFASSATATAGIKLLTTSTGAADGPTILMKYSPYDGSVANGDVMGTVSWQGAATETGNINLQWDDVTAGSRDTSMHFRILQDGVLTEMLRMSTAGVVFTGDIGTTAPVVVTGAGTSTLTMPRVYYASSSYWADCAALTYGGKNYNSSRGNDSVDKHSVYYSATGTSYVGAPGANYHIESWDVSNNIAPITSYGEENLNITLFTDGSGNYYITAIYPDSASAAIHAGPFAAWITDLDIPDVFIFGGIGNDFTFDEAAITGAGAMLWGGDGAGGERALSGDTTTITGGTINAHAFSVDGVIGYTGCFDAADSGESLTITGGIITAQTASNCP